MNTSNDDDRGDETTGPGEPQPPAETEQPSQQPKSESTEGLPAPDAISEDPGAQPADAEATIAAEDDLPEWEPLTPELVEDEAIRGDFVLRWAVILLAFLFGCTQITETETLVHLKTGEYLAAHGWLPPSTDVFSYTASEREWTNLSWLFDLLLAGMFAVGGAIGLSLLKAVLAAVAFGLVVNTSQPETPTWWSSICAALALLACYPQFSATPEIVTLLGLALVLWLLHRWRQTDAPAFLFGMIPLFVVWSNLDPRMFLGLALLVLYGLGDLASGMLGRPSLQETSARGPFWAVVGVCLLAALLNPFGWNALLSPFTLFGVEYPALRELSPRPGPGEFEPFSLMAPEFWSVPRLPAIAGVVVIAATLFVLVLNWSRLEFSHLFVFLGFAGFALSAGHMLAPTAVVMSVLANLNAQQWYRSRFRQTYSVETSELVFSRGGRALTVLAFFLLAFLPISGRLEGADGHRTGLGFDQSLESQIAGYREQLKDSFDNRPFNLLLKQGDVLIWLDQQVFVDSRVPLYAGEGEADLLALHDRTRRALRFPRGESPPDETAQRGVWQATFNQYGVSHVLPRLSGVTPDYVTFIDLLASPHWTLTSLGPSTAVFYRADMQDPALKQYIAQHSVDFVREAFRTESKELAEVREWPQPRSFYDKYLSLPRTRIPNALQEARHYLRLMAEPNLDLTVRTAVGHLAIRRANAGLFEAPQSAEAYRLLGNTYAMLRELEAHVSTMGGYQFPNWMRYYQTLHAFHQSLVIEPEAPLIEQRLFALYLQAERLDLALRALERYQSFIDLDEDELTLEQIDHQRQIVAAEEQLRQRIEPLLQQVDELLTPEADRFQVAAQAFGAGLPLKALEVLEAEDGYLARNPAAHSFYAMLLMEAGRPEEAANTVGMLEGIAGQAPLPQWQPTAALISLANADYARAIRFWMNEARDLQQRRTGSALFLLETLPLAVPSARLPENFAWPLGPMSVLPSTLLEIPYEMAGLEFNAALASLEMGANEQAKVRLEATLETAPETPLRPLVRFYQYLLTGELIELGPPPTDWIPDEESLFEES